MTTPLRQLAAINASMEINQKALAFAHVAKWLALGKGQTGNSLFEAQAARATPEVVEALKAAAQAGTTGDGTWAAPLAYQALSDAFLVSLRNFGVYDAALPFAVDLPLNQQVALVTAGATATSVGEGQVKTISRISLSAQALTPRKVTAIIVATQELLRSGGAKAARLFQQELSRAVVNQTDAAFLSVITSGISGTPSQGSNAVGIANDMAALLGALSLGVGSKVFIAASPGDVKHIAIQISSTGQRAFEGVTINGGDYAGCTIMPTDALTNSIVAFDAAQIAMNSSGVELDSSNQASVQMETAPDSPPSASTGYTSMWQLNQVGLKAERFFGCERLRSTAVSMITGTAYGNANSPA